MSQKLMLNYITKNLKIKIVVVCIAVLLWFFVETENNYKYSMDIPLNISNLSSEKIITNDIPENVKVSLWGRGRELLALMLNPKLQYNLDLSNESGAGTFALEEQNVRFPRISNIEILNIIEPESIDIRIQNLIHKNVAVKADIDVFPLSGYTVVDGIQLSQDSVGVRGAKSALDSIDHVKIERMTFKNVRRDIHKKAKLLDPKVKNAWLEKEELEIFIDVQKLLEKPLNEIPVKVLNKPKGVELTIVPSSLNLTLIGGVDLLLPMTSKDIDAYIDYNKIRGSKEKYYLAYIDKPEHVRIKDIRPKHFKVIVKKRR
ncbi:hypothetical protein GF337_13985 [candidate division KSB1 bacterium]|nr:hypothetical protein [candidate division KSB1 bacterium]